MPENEKTIHKYRKPIDLIQPLGTVGEAVADFGGRQVEQSDDKYSSGVQTIRKYTTPEMEAMALAAIKETMISMKAELNQIVLTASQAEKLIGQGKISIAELRDKGQLRHRLEETVGLSAFDKRKIMRHRQGVHDLLTVKMALLASNRCGDVIGKREMEYLHSCDFYDLGNKRTHELLKTYFCISDNEVLKSVNPASMSQSQIKRLIKTGQRNGFSMQDEAALRLVDRQIKNKAVRMKAGRRLNIRKRIDTLKTYVSRSDENLGAGIQSAAYVAQVAPAGYALAKFGLKAGIVTISFSAKYTGVSRLLTVLNRIRQEKTAQALQMAKCAVRGSRPYQGMVRKKGEIKHRIQKNTAYQRVKETGKSIREKGKAAARKAQRVKTVAKAARRRMRQGGSVVFAPVRFIGKTFFSFGGMFGKLKMAVMAVAGVAVGMFLVLIVLINGMLSICRTESETAMTVILTDQDRCIADLSIMLMEKSEERRTEAERILSDGPQGSYVYGGRALDRYGYPDGEGGWVEGARLVYVNGAGEQILTGANNHKDVIVVAYIIMDANMDGNTQARDNLIDDLWHIMNPVIEVKETDIYCCTGGCSSFSYNCDSDADMKAMEKLRDEGVEIYGEIEVCVDRDNKDEPEQADDNPSGNNKKRECKGHSITVCYGHRDATILVPVFSLDDLMEGNVLLSAHGTNYAGYVRDFEGWTEENREWALSLYQTNWHELYGTDPSAGTGGMAGMGMSREQISGILEGYGSLEDTRAALCSDAMSFVGRIPYYWGGKAEAQSYEGNCFNTAVTPDYKGRDRKGLDCSGFVQWTIWRVTGIRRGGSTSSITSGLEQIDMSALQPGDLGLMNVPGAGSNHVGIFVGYDGKGQALWCHENSADGNVSVNTTACFKYYYRLFQD